MASNDPYPGNRLQPTPKIIDNLPAKTVDQALANAKKQVEQVKQK